jgi:hypothetical protein
MSVLDASDDRGQTATGQNVDLKSELRTPKTHG